MTQQAGRARMQSERGVVGNYLPLREARKASREEAAVSVAPYTADACHPLGFREVLHINMMLEVATASGVDV